MAATGGAEDTRFRLPERMRKCLMGIPGWSRPLKK